MAAELQPGQASLHHGHLFHASGPNSTGDRAVSGPACGPGRRPTAARNLPSWQRCGGGERAYYGTSVGAAGGSTGFDAPAAAWAAACRPIPIIVGSVALGHREGAPCASRFCRFPSPASVPRASTPPRQPLSPPVRSRGARRRIELQGGGQLPHSLAATGCPTPHLPTTQAGNDSRLLPGRWSNTTAPPRAGSSYPALG